MECSLSERPLRRNAGFLIASDGKVGKEVFSLIDVPVAGAADTFADVVDVMPNTGFLAFLIAVVAAEAPMIAVGCATLLPTSRARPLAAPTTRLPTCEAMPNGFLFCCDCEEEAPGPWLFRFCLASSNLRRLISLSSSDLVERPVPLSCAMRARLGEGDRASAADEFADGTRLFAA